MENLANLLDLTAGTVIVTGGALGIGFGIAYRLAEAGANVVIADVNEEETNKAVAEIVSKGWIAKGLKVDVSNEEDVKNMISKTVEMYGAINVLVNNAGIYPSIPIMKMEKKDFEKVIAVNLEGVFLCTKYVAEQMIKQGVGGKIINVSSIDALHPSSVGLAHYDASKHGVWGFTKNSALELAEHKIWVNAIAPGGIATTGVKDMQGKPEMEKFLEAFKAKIPMHRMGDADDIGKVALFLASGMSSYMTGSQIVVDGGVLLA